MRTAFHRIAPPPGRRPRLHEPGFTGHVQEVALAAAVDLGQVVEHVSVIADPAGGVTLAVFTREGDPAADAVALVAAMSARSASLDGWQLLD